MKEFHKKVLIAVILLFVFYLVYSNVNLNIKNEETTNAISAQEAVKQELQEQQAPVKYFTPSSDKIMINAFEKVFYTNSPATTLVYYALDSSNQLVHFRDGDRAFVRILGISVAAPYTQNTEIFHPEKSDGSKEDTIFSGNISITEPGKYLIKVCLGKSINLNSEGTMVWPFGCFEDGASEVVDVHAK